MYEKSIVAHLNKKLFPFMQQPQQQPAALPVMAPQPAPMMDTAPTPATPAPYAQPVRTPQMPQTMPPAVSPDESTVTFNDQSAINAPGWDRSTLERPEMSMERPNSRTKAMPEFTGTPTQIARQQAEWDAENPENKDHGWKGRLKEIAANFLYGMGQAEPGSDWKAALALGGIGAAGGLVNRKWNEQRDAIARIPYLRQKEQFESQQADAKVKRDNTIIDNERQQEELIRKRESDANKAAYYKGLIEDKKRGRDLQGYQLDELRDYRKFLIENGVRNTDARIRQIEAKLEDADLDRKSREAMTDKRITSQEKIAGMNEQGRNDRVRLAAEYRQKGMDYKSKLDEIAKTSDQARKLQLQQEAAKIQQEAIRLRAQID